MNVETALQSLIGLNLDEAREELERDETLRALPIRIVETAPPTRPQFAARTQSVRAAKKAAASTRAPRPETNFGNLRVLRARCEEREIELTIAHETLRDENEIASATEAAK